MKNLLCFIIGIIVGVAIALNFNNNRPSSSSHEGSPTEETAAQETDATEETATEETATEKPSIKKAFKNIFKQTSTPKSQSTHVIQLSETESIVIPKLEGLTIFNQMAEALDINRIEIYRTIEHNIAIAHKLEYEYGDYRRSNIDVVIIGGENDYFYDDQQIPLPSGKAFRQVGIYKHYSSTYPVVVIAGK